MLSYDGGVLLRHRRRANDNPAVDLYLDLLKSTLTRIAFEDETRYPADPELGPQPLNTEMREQGSDWPVHAETMIGMHRLGQLQYAIETVLRERIPGDLIETGVWRGGAGILMRAVLAAYGDTSRTVWLADSFRGLPPPDPGAYPADDGVDWSNVSELAIPLEQVQENFRRYGLLDDHIRFLPGWFRDTLPSAPIEQLAVLRLDGDLYESTIIALEALYPKLSCGGFAIIDDYALPMCRQAVDDFRTEHGISEPLEQVDWSGVHWRRSG
jgi:O-methyltransferase